MIELKNTDNQDKKLKVALVHDYLNQYGGAERVLETFAEMFPDAPIYTLFYDKKLLNGRFKNRIINTSFLDNPFVRRNHRLFIPFFPKAAEFLNLKDKFDLIISDSHGFAKGIKHTKGLHISYMHSPLRYAWEPENYLGTLLPKPLIKLGSPIISYVRRWDYRAAQKPDVLIANSNFIADKIKKYYDRDAQVIYPPVDRNIFYFDPEERVKLSGKEKYFIAFGRLIHYKRFDLIIDAFNKLDLPLIIMGTGPDKKKLEALIESPKIRILSEYPDDTKLSRMIRGAEALIFPQVEDFGLVAAEAISSGVPVIAYAEGGAKEIVEEGKNGVFFRKQHPDSLVKAVVHFLSSDFNRHSIRENSKKFAKENFKRKFSEVIQRHITFRD